MAVRYRFFLLMIAGIAPLSFCTPSANMNQGSGCQQGSEYHYLSSDPGRCSVLPACEQGTPFRNACGCGCKVERDVSGRTFCTEEQRRTHYCVEVYAPVCGWFTERSEDCTGRYCRESYANACFACKDPRVKAYTTGNCSDIKRP